MGTFSSPDGIIVARGEILGNLDLGKYDKVIRLLRLGFDDRMNPVCMLAQSRALKSVVSQLYETFS
jgi:hypothetical protein